MRIKSVKMDAVESLHVSVVLEDAIHQLDILRCLQPRSLTPGSVTLDRTADKTRVDNLEKNVLRNLLEKTRHEILEEKSYNVLIKYLEKEKLNYSFLDRTDMQTESDGRIEQLKLQIQNLKNKKDEELQKRRIVRAHLEDQMQEMKFKFAEEKAYISKASEVDVRMVQRRCQVEENTCNSSLQEAKVKLEDENHINAEMTSFLRNYTKKLKEKLESWVTKSEKEICEKQRELDELKAMRARDTDKLEELLQIYHECEKVVVEERVEKEKLKRKLQMEASQHQAAVKIQCWWRGVMVRRLLGPYKPKSKTRRRKSLAKHVKATKASKYK